MKRRHLRFGRGFRIALSSARSQAAEMVLAPGESEGGARNKHRGADQWLFVLSGQGTARVNSRTYPLRTGTIMLIEHGDRHEVRCVGRGHLRTLNFYVPPAYTSDGNEKSAGKP